MDQKELAQKEMVEITKNDAWTRLFVVFALFITATIFMLTGSDKGRLLAICLVGALATWASLFEFSAIKKNYVSKKIVLIALTSDIVFITVGAHFFDNELLIFSLYLFTIATTASMTSKETYYCAILASVLYPLLLVLEYFNILVPRFSFNEGLFMHIISICPGLLALYVLAYIISYLTGNLKKEKKKTEALSNKYHLLYEKTRNSAEIIFEQMKDGFLIINQDNIIEKNNKSAARLLEIPDLYGYSIESVEKKLGISLLDFLNDARAGKTANKEFTVTSQEIKILDISVMSIKLEEGKTNIVLVIKDITPSWGVVYDSKTKKPIEGCIIRIFDELNSKLLDSRVSDTEGRFEFLVKPGRYYLRIINNKYQFPSKKSKGYKGEIIDISEKNKGVINVKIPMDPIQ